MTKKSSRGEKYQLSASALVIYVSLWAAIFALVRVLVKYSSLGATGPYPSSAAHLTDSLLPVTVGLVLVAIGVAVTYAFGKGKHVGAVAIACFLLGVFALPMLWIVVVIANGLGLLSLD